MVFKTRFHAGIRDGSITVTYRAWASPRVKVGGTYKFGVDGAVEVLSVDRVPLASIRSPDVRRAGFVDKEELGKMLHGASPVYRVEFRCVAREAPAELSVDDVLTRLRPWAPGVLELIAKQPRTRAADLAAMLGRETARFKADVRRLKALGLTISHKVGYELSPLGKAVLARLRRQ